MCSTGSVPHAQLGYWTCSWVDHHSQYHFSPFYTYWLCLSSLIHLKFCLPPECFYSLHGEKKWAQSCWPHPSCLYVITRVTSLQVSQGIPKFQGFSPSASQLDRRGSPSPFEIYISQKGKEKGSHQKAFRWVMWAGTAATWECSQVLAVPDCTSCLAFS